MTKNDRKRVDAFEMWCYRRLCKQHGKTKELTPVYLKVKRLEQICTSDVGSQLRKYRYFGHIVRRDGGIEKQIIQGAVEGKLENGHPSTSWTDDMKNCQEMVCKVHHALQWIEMVGVLF